MTFMVPSASITTGTVVVLIPRILSTSRGVEGYSCINEKTGFVFLMTCNGPVGADGHVPQDGYTVPLSKCYGFMLVPSCLRLNIRLFANLPMHVCNSFVVAVDVFSFARSGQSGTRWSMAWLKWPLSLHFGSMLGFLRMLCWYQHVGRL